MARSNNKIIYTIKEQVYNILKNQILDGTFRPGEWLQEAKIAKDLKVSRSPVREALQQLLGDGLVVNIPNKGVFVREMTERDMQDIFEVRMCFETLGIRRSVETLTSQIREELMEIRAELIKSFEAGDKKSYMREDTRLHQLLIELTGNKLIQDVSVRIYTMEHISRTIALYSDERFAMSLEEHLGIIDGLLEGNVDKALVSNERHLRLAQEESIKQVQKSTKQSQQVLEGNLSP